MAILYFMIEMVDFKDFPVLEARRHFLAFLPRESI
jgi:Sec7-like guanine-nucleotide exchange factor